MIQLHSIESILSENGGGLCGFNIDIGVYDHSSGRTYLPFCVNPHQPLLLSNSHFPGHSDGACKYLYGHICLAQLDTGTLDTEYYLTDALGSVRQLTDSTGAVTFAQTYDPYGTVNTTSGAGSSSYGFTNEYQNQGLVYLRADVRAQSVPRAGMLSGNLHHSLAGCIHERPSQTVPTVAFAGSIGAAATG